MEEKILFRINVVSDGVVLELPDEDGGFTIADQGVSFQKNEDSNILAIQDHNQCFNLFSCDGKKVYQGPRGCSRYFDGRKYFVYRTSLEDIYFEQAFDGSGRPIKLGRRLGNFFILPMAGYELLSFYDEDGDRHTCKYISHEKFVDCLICRRQDGLFDIYNPEDFVYREVCMLRDVDFVPALLNGEKKQVYLWDKQKQAYKRKD